MNAKPKRRMMMLWSLGLLASLSACAVPGDFCEVVSGPIQFPEQVAAVVVQSARPEAVKIDTQNRYGAARCGWKG